MNARKQPWRSLTSLIVSIVLSVSFQLAGQGALYADSVPLAVFKDGATVDPTTVQVDGQDVKVWQASSANDALTLKPASTSVTASSGALYLQVTCLDRGYGRLNVTYRGRDGQTKKPDKFTQAVLSDSGKWMTSLERLNDVTDSGTPDIQIRLERNKDNALMISQASLQNTPFSDPHFQYLLAEDWKRPYAGASAPGIDNSTLKGKVMVGYQGWFRTPNDPYGHGWVHWGDMTRGQFTTDMWPDVSAYPAEALDKAADIKTLSGKPAYLFSSAWPEVEQTHFQWMRENRIDGAFVQRFLGGLYAVNGDPEWVLGNVRAAANQQGRIWAVEYDVSGCPDAKLLDTLKKDWAWMVDDFGVRTDPAYAHEGGKPVVFIWGMGVPDRGITTETANAVIDFFKNDPKYGGNYVIGGVPWQWRKMDAPWQDHFHHYDGILPWMSTSYARDVVDFKSMGVDYYPHVWPGFSWANLKHFPTGGTEQYTSRAGGQFFEGLFSKAVQAGADRLFVGMFDEYDEGTAIIPMSDDPPPTPQRPGTTVKFIPATGDEEHAITLSKPKVDFAFDGTAPAQGVTPENFFMKWEGQIVPPGTGDYNLKIEGPAGDSCSFWIDGKRVIPPQGDERQVPSTQSVGGADDPAVTVTMSAGKLVTYRLDYTHATGAGALKLLWEGPLVDRQEIPASAYVDAWGRFLSNEGKPSDLYLKLAGEAKTMLMNQHDPSDTMIKEPPPALPNSEVKSRGAGSD